MTDPAHSAKNFPLSSAAEDLGLGDQLTQQLQNQVAARRQKLLAAANPSATPTGNAIMDLLGMPSLGGYDNGRL